MQPSRLILTLSIALLCLAVSACGTTRAFPSNPLPPEIPIRAELRQACEAVSTPAAGALPALAPEGTEARRVQLEERAFWMEFVLLTDGVSARQCSRYLEVVGLVDEFNIALREAARSWPK
ncbi:MAG TPA: hypothetical protein PKY87_08090 [Terricaulis sp.]|nr:hypothetical protein [Terricaulis sp.]